MFQARHILLPAFALILGTSLVSAQPGNDHHGMGMMDPQKMADRMTEKLAKELSLNADQKTKLHQIFAEGMGQMKDMHPGEMHQEFMKQMRSGSVDTAALNKDFAARQAKMREMYSMHLKHFAELHAVLTPEQRTKLADFMEKRGKEMRGHWMKDHKDGMDKQEDSK